MALKEILGENSIPQRNWIKLSSALMSFSEQVNDFIAIQKEKKKKRFSSDIQNYASAVTKAATDKGSRVLRTKIVHEILRKYAVKNP